MLNGYAVRPPWNVAGVDYYAGIPSGTTLTGANVASMPSGCAYSATGSTNSGPAVTCSSGSPVLNAIDFGVNNGVQLLITGGSPTIQNSLLKVGSAISSGQPGMIGISGSGNPTFLDDEFNGNDVPVTVQVGQMLNLSGTGALAIKYSYIHNTGGDFIDVNTSTHTLTLEFNYIYQIGTQVTHNDFLQEVGTTDTNSAQIFNTYLQSESGNFNGNGLMQQAEGYGSGQGSMNNGLMANNVIISAATCSFCNFVITSELDPNVTGSNNVVMNNWIDPTGVNSFTGMWLNPNGYYGEHFGNPSWISNTMNMVSGAYYSAYPTSGSFYVVPDANGYTPPLSDLTSVTASPATGTLTTGQVITLTAAMDVNWTVTGSPSLTLSSGGIAAYASGSGSKSLVFSHTITAGETATNLSVTAVSLNGGTIKDALGNSANISTAVGTTFTGLNISTTGYTRTFYISSAGLDTNAGTTQTTAWLHAPGMPNCSNTCASVTPTAGDGYIFRGGDTWHWGNSSLSPYTGGQWNWTWSGNSTSGIYIGSSPSWFSGSSWTRPIFTGDGTFGDTANFVQMSGNYWTLDNFEFTGLYWDSGVSGTFAAAANFINARGAGANWTVEHNYFHGWTHGSVNVGVQYYYGTALMAANSSNGSFVYNVWDGSDTTEDSGSPLYQGPGIVAYNYFSYFESLQSSYNTSVHDNLIENVVTSFDGGHENMYENNSGSACNAMFYNNVIHDAVSSAQFYWGPANGCSGYMFNNVIYNYATTNSLFLENGENGTTGTFYVFNNSSSSENSHACYSTALGGTFTLANDHCITGSGGVFTGATFTSTTDLVETPAVATAAGYTTAETYVYQPTSGSAPTAGAGTNLQSYCTIIAALDALAGSACQADTTYGIAYNATSHTVSSPGRTTLPRPSSAAWDIGAYQH